MGATGEPVPLDSPAGTLGVDAVLETLRSLGDSQRRFSWLLERARGLPGLPAEDRVDANRIQGCQTRLWLKVEVVVGARRVSVDSDAVTLKALGGLLCELAASRSFGGEGVSPGGLMAVLARLGLLRHVAPSRRAALDRVAEKICAGPD